MQLFDSHTHLNDPQLWNQVDYYLQQAQKYNVQKLAVVGSDAQLNQRALTLAKQHSQIHAVIGWHPEAAAFFNLSQQKQLVEDIQSPKVVAIGEIGLDYYWEQNPEPRVQQKAFIEQLEIAQQYHLPVNIHTREAWADTYQILRRHPVAAGMVMHSFNGSLAWLDKFLALGCYVSFSGVVSFKNATAVQLAAQNVLLQRLLLETDAPYLAPEPQRGELNQPAYTYFVAQAIANYRVLPLNIVAQHTFKNACEVYQIHDKN